ncbi:MAG: GGDEF domain-containing protein [Bacillota bacterium]|nr:GGDEF domain-containing protein [Bacillota bacterium]
MFQIIFINICILISVLFITSQVFEHVDLDANSSFSVKFIIGIIGGILGILLMYFSIHITPTIILDFRSISQIIAAIFGGIISITITGFILAIFRLFYLGLNCYSLIASITIIAVSLGYGIISKLKFNLIIKLVIMFIYSLFVRSIYFIIVLKNRELLLCTLASLWIGSIIVCGLVYLIVLYLIAAHNQLKKLKEESSKDFLTGLGNVRSFDVFFKTALNDAKTKNEKLSLLMIDIDFFKNVNDTHGHPAGDIVLKELGNLLINTCRFFDMISRIGGEEFSVILPDCSSSQALEVAERLRQAVEKHDFILSDGKIIHITISVGASTYPETVQNLDQLIQKADQALYLSKQTGRNKVSIIM